MRSICQFVDGTALYAVRSTATDFFPRSFGTARLIPTNLGKLHGIRPHYGPHSYGIAPVALAWACQHQSQSIGLVPLIRQRTTVKLWA